MDAKAIVCRCVLLSLAFHLGCTAMPVRLSPIEGHDESFYTNDREFAVSVKSHSEIRLAAEIETTANEIVIWLACRNRSPIRLDFFPGAMIVTAPRDVASAMADTGNSEKQLKVCTAREYRKNLSDSATIGALAGAMGSAMAEANTRDPIAREVKGLRNDLADARSAEQEAQAYQAITSRLLGRETLFPGMSVFGEVRVLLSPVRPTEPELIKIVVPVGIDVHTILLRAAGWR